MKQTSEEAVASYILAPGSDRTVPPVTSADRTLSTDPAAVETGRGRLVGVVSSLLRDAAVGVLSDGDLTTACPPRSTLLPMPVVAEPGLLFIADIVENNISSDK